MQIKEFLDIDLLNVANLCIEIYQSKNRFGFANCLIDTSLIKLKNCHAVGIKDNLEATSLRKQGNQTNFDEKSLSHHFVHHHTSNCLCLALVT